MYVSNVCMYVFRYGMVWYGIYVYMYVSMYLCNICNYVSMYLCNYVSMYLCIYVSMYLYIYVSMYLCIYVSVKPGGSEARQGSTEWPLFSLAHSP